MVVVAARVGGGFVFGNSETGGELFRGTWFVYWKGRCKHVYVGLCKSSVEGGFLLCVLWMS